MVSPFEPREVAVTGEEAADAVLKAECGDVCVMDQVAGRSGSLEHMLHDVRMA